MESISNKSNKITDIVRLQQILKKWKRTAKANNSSTSKSIKFLKRTLSLSENSASREPSTSAVPKGYLAVCVGEELKRFIIPTHYLGHPAFHLLLQEAEEEFGFQQTGVLRIPCQVGVFESVLKLVEEKKDSVYLMLEYCSRHQTQTHHPHSPMCR